MTVDIPMDLFEPEPNSYEPASEYFVVTTREVEAAVRALERAGERMLCTDAAGVEHSDYEAANAGGEHPPPSYVADPEVTDAGILGYVDCSGDIFPEQAATFRMIIRGELEVAGVNATVRSR